MQTGKTQVTVSEWSDQEDWSEEDDEEIVYPRQQKTVRSTVPSEHDRRGVQLVELYRHTGGIKYWAIFDGVWIVGGPGNVGQDAVSLNLTPEASKGLDVKIDRFQVRKRYRRQGFGTLVLRELVRLYRESGALKFLIPVVSFTGGRFYRKCGSVRGVELHEIELQSFDFEYTRLFSYSFSLFTYAHRYLCLHTHAHTRIHTVGERPRDRL